MFFDYSDTDSSYRIGKVTIDKSFHTQSADENFYNYFCNDTLYSMTRTIHPDDLELFKETVNSLSDDEVKYSLIRMKRTSGEYKWMIVKMSVNIQMLARGRRYTDIIVKDALLLEKNTTGLENIIDRFRFLMSVQESIIFEYESHTGKFYIYSFDYNTNTVFFNEDFDYFHFHVLSENMIAEASRDTFESFYESVKNGISRFRFELETGILTNGEQIQSQEFSGFTVTDGEGRKTVLGLISPKNTEEEVFSASNPAYEANLDPLTRLFNKKAITNYALSRIESGAVESVTIVIIDVDNFKYINDTYGHLFGDEIICTAASVLKKETGSKGVAGRIGGDEFMLVLDNISDEMELRSILRAVRSNIEVLCAEKTDGLKVTCSMGTAAYPYDADSYQQLFMTADKALYIAKEKGKDRYVIYNKEKHGEINHQVNTISTGSSLGLSSALGKASAVGNLISDYALSGKITLMEALEIIGKKFELDRIEIFAGDNLSFLYSWPESDEKNDALYILNERYSENFSDDNVFVIDNTDILEGRYSEAFSRLIRNGVNAAVQYVYREDGKIKGYMTYELLGHYKKWPQMDVNFMNVLSKIIFETIFKGENKHG